MREPQLDSTKLRAGDEIVLSELFNYLSPRIHQFARLHGATDLAADEIVSDVFLQLIRDRGRLADLAGKGILTEFCLKVARNAVMHHTRQAEKRSLYDLADEGPRIEPDQLPADDSPAAQELRQTLEEALARLDQGSRELVTMFYERGLTAQEIGDVLGVSTNAVKVRLHRVLGRLRSMIKQDKETK